MVVDARTASAEKTVREHLDAWNRHDPDAITRYYTDDAKAYDPSSPEPLQGKAALRKDAEQFIGAFPDLKMEVSNIVCNGDSCGYEMVASGTHRGTLEGAQGSIPPTNRRMESWAGIFVKLNDQGLITEEHRYYDQTGFVAQLGAGE
ncbi:MAG: ester cyclase [Terriglobia bacterium]